MRVAGFLACVSQALMEMVGGFAEIYAPLLRYRDYRCIMSNHTLLGVQKHEKNKWAADERRFSVIFGNSITKINIYII